MYPRGIYNENGVMKYLYYADSEPDMAHSPFKGKLNQIYLSKRIIFIVMKSLEEAYNEYIEQKSSI